MGSDLHPAGARGPSPCSAAVRRKGVLRPGRSALLALCCWALGLSLVRAAPADGVVPPPRVLVLDSYHPGHLWADAELEGAVRVLKQARPDLLVSVEYLDRDRRPDPADRVRVDRILGEKYMDVPFAVVVALDQTALDLLVARRETLFPGAPVAFCGVEDLPRMADGAARWFAGALERMDPVGTVQLALRLQPHLRRLLVFSTATTKSQRVRSEILKAMPGLQERVAVDVLTNAPLPDLFAQVAPLGADSAILVLPSNDVVPVQAALRTRTRAPLYGLQSPNQLGLAVGGSYSDGHRHGEAAARIALRLLAGEAAAGIPVVDPPPYRLAVDHAEARRLGLDLTGLPSTAEPVNRPPTLWQRHGRPIVGSALVLAVLVLGMASLVRAVRLRRRAEAALGASEQRYRLLVENSHDVVTEMSADGTMLFCTANVSAVLGHGAADVVGRDAFQLVHPDDLAGTRTSFMMPKGTLTFRVRHQDGSWRWIETSSQRYRPDDGSERVVLVSRDVTERVVAAQEHERMEENLRQAKKLEALGTLAGGIAHDFNNLLTVILGNTGLLREDFHREGAAGESVAQIERAAFRARDLIKQVLTFSRAQATRRHPLQLGPLIEEAADLARSTAPATSRILIDCPVSLPSVPGDATQMHQVLLNLCNNALQAMGPAGGRVEITARTVDLDEGFCQAHPPLRAGPHVRLTVGDTGPGIDAATLAHIFEPFFTTKEPGQGTGLGLAVVHGVVTGHQGSVTVRSRPGEGTCFEIHLPASTEDGAAPAGPRTEMPLGHGERILLVDDEPQVAAAGRRMVEVLGYTAEVCHSPKEALEVFRREPEHFALVITDLAMPGMNGTALAQEILGTRPGVPVLLMSGNVGMLDEAAVRMAGLRGVLDKPFDAVQIATAIHRCLGVPPRTV